jgi:hypothetical protein
MSSSVISTGGASAHRSRRSRGRTADGESEWRATARSASEPGLHPDLSAAAARGGGPLLQWICVDSLGGDDVVWLDQMCGVDGNVAGDEKTRATMGLAPIQRNQRRQRVAGPVGQLLAHRGFRDTVGQCCAAWQR